MSHLIYLASPYSHPDPEVEKYRYETVCKVAGELMARGFHVYSPIAHSRAIAIASEFPHDFNFWEATDRDMITRCDSVYVLMLPGWEDSQGVQAEIQIAKELGKPFGTLKEENEGNTVLLDT